MTKHIRKSMFTGKTNTMALPDSVTLERIHTWENTRAALVQDAFPELNADQREFLMTGATPEEWASIFGADEGEE